MYRLLTKRERIISYIAAAVVIFSIAFNFLLAPALKTNDILNKEINLARAKLYRYAVLLSQKEEIQNKYSKFSEALGGAQQKEDTFVSVLSELEGLAKNANIHIVDIRPQSASAKSSGLYKEASIDLRTEGPMDSYIKFIYSVENSLLLLKIKKLQLAARPNSQVLEGNFSILQLSVTE